jgi:hypothetical protein
MVYKPGDWVPQSGIYDVIHDKNHHQKHQVTCIEHKRFPPCRSCGREAEFRLVEATIHIEDHQSFKT